MVDFDWSTADDWDASSSEENVVHETGADLPGDSTVTLGYPARDVNGTALEHFFRLSGSDSTTATDAMGVTDGTVYGATPEAAGINGGSAFEFDGTDDYITFGQPTISGEFTLLCWIYPLTALDTGIYKIIAGPYNVNQNQTSWELKSMSSGTLAFGSWNGSQNGAEADSSTLPIDTWSSFAGRYDGSQWDVFVNGSNVTTNRVGDQSVGPLPSTEGQRAMGAHWKSNAVEEFFHGRIQNVRLYSRALSDAEMQTLSDAPLSGSLTTAAKQ